MDVDTFIEHAEFLSIQAQDFIEERRTDMCRAMPDDS